MSPQHHALVEQLASPLPEVREQARQRLVEAGKAAVPALVDGLGSPEKQIRAGAALCLGRIGFTGAARVLAAMVEQDPDESVRPLALRALADLASPEGPPVIRSTLLHQLEQGDLFARALACRGLGRIDDNESRAALQRALGDVESWVREAARKALEPDPVAAEDRAAAPAEQQPSTRALVPKDAGTEAVDQLLVQLASPEIGRQREAKRRLTELGQAVVAPLGRLLQNEHSPARRPAVEVLGAVGGTEAMQRLVDLLQQPGGEDLRAPVLHAMARCLNRPEPPLSLLPPDVRELLEQSDDELVRAAAARVLVVAGGPDRRAAVEQAMAEEPWVQVSTLAALAETADAGDRALVPLLAAGLERAIERDDADLELPLSALSALARILAGGNIDPTAAEPAVRCARMLVHEDDMRVRTAAGRVLATAARPEDVDPATMTELVDLLSEGNAEERIAMIRAVGRLCGPATSKEAVDALLRLLQTQAGASSGPGEAREAARALASTGDRRAIDSLVDLANSRQGAVVSIAASALASLDPRARVVGVKGPDGRWETRVQHWCDCGGALRWVQRQREELRCVQCDREYVLAASGQRYPAESTPFGTCLCPECRRRQPLIRRPGGDALFCPLSGRVHIRPFDHPAQLRLLSEMPLGACTCCAEPQPLIRVNEDVVCYRTRERYQPTARGFAPRRAGPADPADHVAAINEALLAGSIGIGQSGLATASALDGATGRNTRDSEDDDESS